jgi:hypothetical protein
LLKLVRQVIHLHRTPTLKSLKDVAEFRLAIHVHFDMSKFDLTIATFCTTYLCLHDVHGFIQKS